MAWIVKSDPSGKGLVNKINTALALYQKKGMTKQGASMLVGNFITESGLKPEGCNGDNGTACGLAQWRFSRTDGLPHGFTAQLNWAVDVEMQRSGCGSLRTLLFNPTATPDDIFVGLKGWERWGVVGDRYAIGKALLAQIQ